MTDREKVLGLFSQCSIWRGGCAALEPDKDGYERVQVHMAYLQKNGKTAYMDVIMKFDDGSWVSTEKA